MTGGIKEDSGKSLSSETCNLEVVAWAALLNFQGYERNTLILAFVRVVVVIDTCMVRSFSAFASYSVPLVVDLKLLTTRSKLSFGEDMGTIPKTGFLSKTLLELSIVECVSNLNIPDI